MRQSRYQVGLWLVVAMCLVVIGWVSSYGHGDEKHDEKIDIGQALKSNSIIQVKLQLDSVWAEIGATYSTIEPILRKSCYDCHSNQTNYPWYYKIPTLDAMIDSDIKEAREHIDLSNGFPFGGHADQLSQLRAIREEVGENDMPLWSYRIMHWGATIEGATEDSLFEWIDKSVERLETVYNSLGIPIKAGDDDGDDEDDD